jgi:hypothetical protein
MIKKHVQSPQLGSKPDDLIRSAIKGGELTEHELGLVTGGALDGIKGEWTEKDHKRG